MFICVVHHSWYFGPVVGFKKDPSSGMLHAVHYKVVQKSGTPILILRQLP